MKIFGYIILFYIGFYFYRLAENYNRNKWLYGFLGILLFFIGFFAYAFYKGFTITNSLEEFDIVMVSIKSILIGVLTSFVTFHVLDYKWKRNNIN